MAAAADGYTWANSGTDFALGSAWTVELWVQVTGDPGTSRKIAGQGLAAGQFTIDMASTNNAVPYLRVAGLNTIISGGGALTTGVNYHVAAVCDQGHATEKYRLYVNGTKVGASASTTTVTSSADIKAGQAGGLLAVKDLRVTKGVARYLANFTPPTTANPTI